MNNIVKLMQKYDIVKQIDNDSSKNCKGKGKRINISTFTSIEEDMKLIEEITINVKEYDTYSQVVREYIKNHNRFIPKLFIKDHKYVIRILYYIGFNIDKIDSKEENKKVKQKLKIVSGDPKIVITNDNARKSQIEKACDIVKDYIMLNT